MAHGVRKTAPISAAGPCCSDSACRHELYAHCLPGHGCWLPLPLRLARNPGMILRWPLDCLLVTGIHSCTTGRQIRCPFLCPLPALCASAIRSLFQPLLTLPSGCRVKTMVSSLFAPPWLAPLPWVGPPQLDSHNA